MCGDCVLALQAAALDLDGGGARSAAHRWRKHGAGVAWARRCSARAVAEQGGGGGVVELCASGG